MSPPPWLDLPTPLTEKILERLPLSGYVRFAAVCRQWRYIQIDHRRRHAPSPPPMLKLPWLIPCKPKQEIVSCYSPFEDRFYRIRLPNHCLKPYSESLPNGWLFRYDAIVNPISGIEIPLPERSSSFFSIGHIAAVSPAPNLVVFFIMNDNDLFLFRPGDRKCTRLPLDVSEAVTSPLFVSDAVAFGGKLYCLCPDGLFPFNESNADHLAVVDPILTMPPSVQFYKMMDWIKTPLDKRFGRHSLVESNGQVLLVREIRTNGWPVRTVGFQVFRPNLSKRMWERVESLGDDQLLILQGLSYVSLYATDVGIKGNCIYFSTRLKALSYKGDDAEPEAPWKAFNLGTGTVTEVPFPNASLVEKITQFIFVPSIS